MHKRNCLAILTLMGLLTVTLTGCALFDLFRRTEHLQSEQRTTATGQSAGDNSPVYVTSFNMAQMGGAAGVACLFMLWLFVRERYKASALSRVMGAIEYCRDDGSADDVVHLLKRHNDQTERVIKSMARKFGRQIHGKEA